VAFFDLVPGGLEDLDLHRLLAQVLAQRALQLPNAELRGPEFARRHHVLIRRDRRPAPTIDQVLPSPDHRLVDPQLATQLSKGDLFPQDAGDLLPLELGSEEPPPVRTPPLYFHRTILS
jgi:hypothetical protein